PTIGNKVVIGAAAIILGPITIGDGARVGANSVVVNSVPPGVTVVGIPGRVVEDRRETIFNLEHGKLPDPVSDALRAVIDHQNELEKRIKELEDRASK
ncbi:MAG: serine O-acetyltransferase, partial [Chloroflexi bacterium]|nr:serine O-acetyltransferase [Chloroflexota bacterium]